MAPVFQPIIDLRTGKTTGFEVLARWNHATRGLHLPPNFIPLAEQAGLIDALTDHILRKAFTEARDLRSDLRLSVNISPLQLRHRHLAARLRTLCRETGMSPERLTIEITESAIIDNLAMAAKVAADLKNIGCHLSLDDFGTGYSSLVHLKSLPFDELKIDLSFVREITVRRESRKIVCAVLDMAHALGLRTVAEGIETEEQCKLLFRLGCHAGQGWLYGKPLPGAAVASATHCGNLCNCHACPRAPVDYPPLRSAASEQAAQLNALYIGAPVGLCLLDKQMRYVSINRQLAEINGQPEHEHIGKTPKELIPDVFPTLEPHLRAALDTGRPASFEVQHRRGVDDERTALVSYAPVYDETAEITGVSVAIIDVTQRVRAERALNGRMECYRSLMAVSPFMPWLADRELNIVEISPKWLEMTGLDEGEVLGFGWPDAIHPEDVSIRAYQAMHALKTREPFDVQYRVRTARGDWTWVRCKGWPRFARTGELAGWCGYIVDVEQHRRETEEIMDRLQNLRSLRLPPAAPVN